jgi:hypothetical protein
MFKMTIDFRAYPRHVKKAIVYLTLGWAAHLLFYFKFLPGQASARSDYLMVAVGVMTCYFTAGINAWARMLSLFGNVVILVFYLYMALLVFQKSGPGLQVMTVLVIVLFALSSYFLLLRDTADYFRRHEADETQNGHEDGGPNKT